MKQEKSKIDLQGRAAKISLMVAAILVAAFLAEGAVPPPETQTLPVNDYRIGAKDLLDIAVFELPELNQTVRVSEDGSITLSLLGKVDVGGLTAQDLEKKLTTLLDQQYTKGAHVTVFIKEYQKVSIIGAVGLPGQYQLIGPTTLLQAIAQAGGLTAQAMDEIIIYRQGQDGKQERISVRRDDLLTGGGLDVNIMLQPKDVVTIAIDQTLNVFVYGEVKTPGAIPYLSSKKITLVQAIAQAGGPTEWAKKSRVVIKRKDRKTGKEMQIRVNLKKMISGKIADITLEEGDIVIVP